MGKALLVASIFFFFSQLSYAKEYTVEEIDVECSKQASLTEKVAIARDEGLPKVEMLNGLDLLLVENLITEIVYKQATTITEWVYKYPIIKPADMGFLWKDNCVDVLLQVEKI